MPTILCLTAYFAIGLLFARFAANKICADLEEKRDRLDDKYEVINNLHKAQDDLDMHGSPVNIIQIAFMMVLIIWPFYIFWMIRNRLSKKRKR